jgi:UDP-GlcNAc:undecaprenyl-phosphate GlcNAc-1-phosphate transferase
MDQAGMDIGRIAVWITLVAATVAALFVLRPLCYRYNLLDHPDERKQHGTPVPVAGGIAMLLVIAPTMLGATVIDQRTFYGHWWIVLAAAMALLCVGMIDDRRGMKAGPRLVVQLLAALAVVYIGDFKVTSLGALGELGAYSGAFTVLVIVTFLNACNMVDGADGLLGSVLLPPLVAIAVIANEPLNWGSGLLAAAVLGFLILNWPAKVGRRARMRVFMGNGGVMFIGLFTAAVLIRATGSGSGVLRPGTVPMLVLIPLAELATTCVRRVIRRVSPLLPDRGHLHHYLLYHGFSPRQLAWTYLMVSTVSTAAIVLMSRSRLDGLWLWAAGAALLTTVTLAEIWRSTPLRNFHLGDEPTTLSDLRD